MSLAFYLCSLSAIALSPLIVRADTTQIFEIGAYEEQLPDDSFQDTTAENDNRRSQEQRTNTDAAPKRASSEQRSCMRADYPQRISLSHIESKGIGYNEGYTSLKGFFTEKVDYYIPFIDLRAHVFNNGRWATNLGFGTRYVIDPALYMIGGNFYYDYRSTKHSHYNQISVGLEAFLERWELRANGYLPVGSKKKRLDHDLNWISFKKFAGNNILINENYTDTFETAMRGFNAEVGVHPLKPMANYDLFVGAGPYYFNANEGRTTWGGKARIKAKVSQYLYLELSDSYDHVFHNRFQGTLTLSYPFGGKKCYKQKSKANNTQLIDNLMYWRAVQPVERQEIIVTSKRKKTYTIDPIAIDPTTGQPFFVVFVNNTNSSPGNGTFESPFQSLSARDANPTTNAETNSAPGNIIYVFAGDGTANNMNTGIILQANQRFLGSGTPHQFQTTKGLLTVPVQTSIMPHIQGRIPGGSYINGLSGVRLASNNEVSGFDIRFLNEVIPFDPTTGIATATTDGLYCIDGTSTFPDEIINANINNNNLVGETYGVAIGNFGSNATRGTFIISNNTMAFQSAGGMEGDGFNVFIRGVHNADVIIANNACNIYTDSISTNNIQVNMHENVNALVTNNLIFNSTPSTSMTSTSTGIAGLYETVASNLPSRMVISNNTISDVAQGIVCESAVGGVLVQFIIENNIINNTTIPSTVTTGSDGIQMCIRCTGNGGTNNPTPAAFTINNAAGSGNFYLEPAVNDLTISYFGDITPVLPCDCGSGNGDGCPTFYNLILPP